MGECGGEGGGHDRNRAATESEGYVKTLKGNVCVLVIGLRIGLGNENEALQTGNE